MKKQILEKTYEVSQKTRKVLDCKMLNIQLYDAIYDIVNEFYSSEADTIMEEKILDAYNRIDDFLTEYLGISVTENLSDLDNTAGERVRI